MTDGEKKGYPLWHNAVAGSVAGFGSRMATAPLDLLRIRSQLNYAVYPSILQSWRSIIQKEGGITALYRGNVAAIYLWISYSAVQFSIYNYQMKYHTNSFAAGALAGVGATLLTYPFDVCRSTFAARGVMTEQRMPMSSFVEPPLRNVPSSSPPTTIWQFARELYSKKGIGGFYAGVGPAIVLILPYMGLNFWLYEKIVQSSNRPVVSLYAGGIAGALSKCIVYPMDTIKRRLMVQAFYEKAATSRLTGAPYSSALDCFQQIVKEEGFLSLYRGVATSVLKTTLSSGLSFGLFRLTKNSLETLYDGAPQMPRYSP